MSSRQWIVTKAPVDLPGAAELVGTFDNRQAAIDACDSPGTYYVAEVEVGRVYKSGQLLDVEVRHVKDHREFGGVMRANGH